MRRFLMTAAVLLSLVTTPVAAAPYTVDHTVSRIEFGGTHAGTPFSGTFDSWGAEIDFDPAAPEQTKIRATIDLASAKTGNKMFDGTLPNEDWFDIKNSPTGTFTSTGVTANADGSYIVTGNLTLRGVTKPISFVFTLDNKDAPVISASAKLNIDRLDYGIGKKSDASAEWVSQSIDLTIKLTAKRDATAP